MRVCPECRKELPTDARDVCPTCGAAIADALQPTLPSVLSPQAFSGTAGTAGGIAYDPQIIEGFAFSLYAQAARISAGHALVGGLLGGVIGVVLSGGNWFLVIVAAAIAGWIGFEAGRQKALVLRLQAQTALCQVQIEKNTRSRM